MEILPPDAIPPQMHMVNGIVDFGNIRDLIAFLTLEETGIAVEANISLNEGHNCIAYNMIRTPNLSKESFQAVPSDAIGLLSFALSGADSIQAASVGQQLRNMTGLDFGREIFANIEQVTLFITPPENSPMQDGNQWISIPSNIGLAVTSRNPQQTRQFINQVLTIAGLVSNSTGSNQPEQASGKYLIELNNGMQLHCYQDQSKKISLFSMSPKVIDASLNSISSKKSALTAGPLQKALSAMSPNTSKIFAMNLGSIMSQANISIGSEEDNANLQPLFAQLAEGFNKTTLQLRTNESQNNLNIRYSVDDLPPLGEVFAPMMQIGQIMSQMQQPSGSWGIKASPPAVVARADTPPVIDGKAENLWSKSQKTELNNKLYSAISSDEDLSADYMAMWDKDNLYVFVNVIDDSMKNDSDEHYQDDSIEIFIDADNSKTGEYDDNDYQYYFRWQKENPFAGIYNRGNIQDNIKYKLVTTENGYNLEVMFPWSTFDTKAFPGVKIGLDIHVNDDDDGGDRDSKITWNDSQDSGWENTRAFGTGELAGLIGWWKLDESNGTVVADSSGNGNNGKIIGDAKWQPSGGKTGGAISLDGDGDYIEIANESNFDFAGEVTLSAWIKANQLDKEYQAIVTKGDSAWRIQRNQDQDTLEFACSELQVQNGNQYGSLFGTKTINDGKWHHIAGVYDGEKMYIYMDGIVDVSQSASGAIATNDYPVFIGENAQETSRCWCGIIDDVRVYNYALSEDEILALYNGK